MKHSNLTDGARRLLAYWHTASDAQRAEGLNWYPSALAQCGALAKRYGISAQAVAGVVAALSPGLRWEVNIDHAEQAISAWRNGASVDRPSSWPVVGVYGRNNVRKALAILAGADPLELFSERTSPKVRSFFLSILGDQTQVCIDRHAIAAWRGASLNGATPIRKSELTAARADYRLVADIVRVAPRDLQAVVWTVYRESNRADILVANDPAGPQWDD